MPRFFIDDPIASNQITVGGEDMRHITRSLRMGVGEGVTVCDGHGTDYDCVISDIFAEELLLEVVDTHPTLSEPSIKVTLFQGMPKGDKLDTVIQKSVELGVNKIIPFFSNRTVVKYDPKTAAKKTARRNRIALEAAKQSGRGIIPVVEEPCDFKAVLDYIDGRRTVFFYEGGGEPLKDALGDVTGELVIVIGSEGGFDESEMEQARDEGAFVATLGKRILRTETAPIAVISMIMYDTDNMI